MTDSELPEGVMTGEEFLAVLQMLIDQPDMLQAEALKIVRGEE